MPFSPKFCPNPDCFWHRDPPPHATWFHRRGTYRSRRAGVTQRFSCTRCGRSFSSQTFSIDYWTRCTLDWNRIFRSICSASGILDIAREFSVTDKVIINRIQRLSRQAMGMMMSVSKDLQITEDVAVDGFESFVYSQYFPNNFTLAVGTDSQFLYCCDYAQIRRKGRMTDGQKRRREIINRKYPFTPQQIKRSFADTLREVVLLWNNGDDRCSRQLRSDMKTEYARELAMNSQWKDLIHGREFTHLTVSSREVRNTDNPLMSVNYFDREIRKDQACHVRQTLQWSKSVNNAMDRMMVYMAYHNFWKPYRIKGNSDRSHGEEAGITGSDIYRHRRRFFTRRYFLKGNMPQLGMWKTWFHLWRTPVYDLKIDVPAFAST